MRFKKNLIRILVFACTGVLAFNILTSLVRNINVLLLFFITPTVIAFTLLNIRELKAWIRKKYSKVETSMYKSLIDEEKILNKLFIPLINQVFEDIKRVDGKNLAKIKQIYGETFLNSIIENTKKLDQKLIF